MEVPRRTTVLRGARLLPRARGMEHRPAVLDSYKVAGVPAEVVRQLQTLGGWDAQAFCPSAPAGATPTALPAELHFSTFISAFVAVLEYGMGNAPPASITTVAELRYALETVEKSVPTYLQFHARDRGLLTKIPRTACPRHEPWSRGGHRQARAGCGGRMEAAPPDTTSPGCRALVPTPRIFPAARAG